MFSRKKNFNLLIDKNLIKVKNETAYIEEFQEKSQEKNQYFNCK